MHAYTGAAATTATTFKPDDYVLYRNPEKFWKGEPNHTFVCRVEASFPASRGQVCYTLTRLSDNGRIYNAQPAYMRLLPSADAMRDIDTAPLSTDAVADDMTPAAVAWLTQQAATASRRPELPPKHA
ncbi:hypothetical protein ACIPYQ_39065 [Streptomyces sp. NPDC090045]|uniref:hypothetical protein n=1 Tax=Streptomyces sp. NPDC090045 TaxID=3365927 RepID=UPI0037FDCB30